MPLRARRLAPLLAATLAAAPLSACAADHSGHALAVAPAIVSHQLCSAAFVAKVDPETYYREALAPDLAFLEPLVRHHVDRAKGEVTASLFGYKSRAVYRGATYTGRAPVRISAARNDWCRSRPTMTSSPGATFASRNA